MSCKQAIMPAAKAMRVTQRGVKRGVKAPEHALLPPYKKWNGIPFLKLYTAEYQY